MSGCRCKLGRRHSTARDAAVPVIAQCAVERRLSTGQLVLTGPEGSTNERDEGSWVTTPLWIGAHWA